MAYRVFVLNGPNLNMLGRREPEFYGRVTLAEIQERCATLARALDLDLFFGQSNMEGKLIEWLHQACDEEAAVVINPAGLSYGSVALHDAMKIVQQPIVEVHLTNIFSRDTIYHEPLTSRAAWGVIAGLGPHGYELAMRAIAARRCGLDDGVGG